MADGFIAVGAPTQNDRDGAVLIASTWPAGVHEMGELAGEDDGKAGTAVVAVSDLNDDGAPELLVGIPNVLEFHGAAYLAFSPFTSDGLLSEAGLLLTDVAPTRLGDHVGWSDDLSGAGTAIATNQSGAGPELLGWSITDGSDQDSDGAAFEVTGLAGSTGETATLLAVDGDGDGTDDPFLGDHDGSNGCMRVLRGPLSGTLAAGDAETTCPLGLTDFGSNLASLGDRDRDGLPDVAVSAGAHSRVHVFSGAVVSADDAILVVEGGSNLGRSLTTADIDSNGSADLLVGSSDEVGSVFYGISEGTLDVSDADVQLVDSAGAGFSAATAELDGDGFDDAVFGVSGLIGRVVQPAP
ncbi:MAG: hypothetical protein GY884_15075 [Proteobacteria bacterium]|nr:hypothetical protein [Pseudomonadota bacterium]